MTKYRAIFCAAVLALSGCALAQRAIESIFPQSTPAAVHEAVEGLSSEYPELTFLKELVAQLGSNWEWLGLGLIGLWRYRQNKDVIKSFIDGVDRYTKENPDKKVAVRKAIADSAIALGPSVLRLLTQNVGARKSSR